VDADSPTKSLDAKPSIPAYRPPATRSFRIIESFLLLVRLCKVCAISFLQSFATLHDSARAVAQFLDERRVVLLDVATVSCCVRSTHSVSWVLSPN
jgi:hypothetical protein